MSGDGPFTAAVVRPGVVVAAILLPCACGMGWGIGFSFEATGRGDPVFPRRLDA